MASIKIWHVVTVLGVAGGLLYVIHMSKQHKGTGLIDGLTTFLSG